MQDSVENRHAKINLLPKKNIYIQFYTINSEGHFVMMNVVISLTPNFNNDLLKNKLSN